MKALFLSCICALTALLAPAAATADLSEYGIEAAEAGASTAQAGAHPDLTTYLSLKREPSGELPATTRTVLGELPAGLLGNPSSVPTCTIAQFSSTNVIEAKTGTGCPVASQVGLVEVELKNVGGTQVLTEPLYNLAHRYGQAARLGFYAVSYPVLLDARLRSGGDYGVTVASEGIASLIPLLSVRIEAWADPADPSHDSQRFTPYEAIFNSGAPETSEGKREAGVAPLAFMTNPTRCGAAQGVDFEVVSYALPGTSFEAFAPLAPNFGCDSLSFEPDLQLAPSTEAAESGAGLTAKLTMPTAGLEDPALRAEDRLRRAEVALPEGMTVNPSQAVGLGVCSEEDFAHETAFSGPNDGCPESSKIGSAVARSPLAPEPAEGSLYIAKPEDNPFGSLIALYMTLKIPERGVIVKLAGKVEPDPKTGQIVTVFGEPGQEIPQLPVSSFELHFREGARSPLVTPPRCGAYAGEATFTTWGGHTLTTHPSFQVARGPDGRPCPQGSLPFDPGFEAGSESDTAGAHSPFDMRLTRRDGEQDLTKFSAHFPPGLTAKLAGVSQCPDATLAAAASKAGRDEQASPSCPASSEIGNALAGAGVGQVLTYATGKIYLAGPYKGALISAVAIVPAVAGPFDVGTVVTRVALRVDPKTAQVEVDGSASDPIPHILAGIPLKVRDIRVDVDRPEFSLNPTSCEPFAVGADIWGGGDDVFSAADDSPVDRSVSYQVANCLNLGFHPRLAIRLKGGVRRGAHPGLRAVVTPRPGDANFSRAVVKLPRSAFLDQAHIRTICTRVQFAAGAGHGSQCPPGARYGYARAWSPILDGPAQGPVFLRSSDNNLPDLVVALTGPPSVPAEVELSARIDSVRGGIRSTFAAIPDLPVSRFVLQMQGGKKGLIVNSRHLCFKPNRNRVRANIGGQNGRVNRTRPRLVALTCAKRRKAKRKRARRAAGHVSRASRVG